MMIIANCIAITGAMADCSIMLILTQTDDIVLIKIATNYLTVQFNIGGGIYLEANYG